jgi:hypothetical protein
MSDVIDAVGIGISCEAGSAVLSAESMAWQRVLRWQYALWVEMDRNIE